VIKLGVDTFDAYFEACHGVKPFRWQRELIARVLDEGWPKVLALPTGTGKTAVLDIALFALAAQAGQPPASRTAPRRIVFVVDRRVVVNATAERARRILTRLESAAPGHVLAEVRTALLAYGGEKPLRCAELRGGVWRDEAWARTPLQPTVLVSTVDQVGSRLLHRGYGLSPSAWPLHAGLLANDALIVLDEAHLSRPFEDTLAAITKYRTCAETPLALPFRVVRMSATPGTTDGVFPTDPGVVLQDDRLRPRLARAKQTTWVSVEKPGDFGKRCRAETLRLVKEGARTVAVIVNRVGTAREIQALFETDKAKEKATRDVILLTGRCRSHDRDALLARYQDRLLSGRVRDPDAQPLIVVATQCVEAGADFDFDALVTECCPLDSLRQRLGRLNRIGALPQTEVVVLARQADIEKKDDPIYGAALAETWNWLQTLDSPANLSTQALTEAIPADCSALLAPIVPGPLVFPAYCDLWAQTSPESCPTPDPAVFLHGPQRGVADVQVVWRADLTHDNQETWHESLAVLPPLAGEALPVRIHDILAWLAGNQKRSKAAAAEDADVEGAANGEETDEPANRPFLVWRGKQHTGTATTNVTEIHPGCTIVVPAYYGGCDLFGWHPACETPVSDIAEQVRRSANLPPRLRICEAVLGAAAWQVLQPLSVNDGEADESPPVWQDAVKRVAGLPDVPEWLKDLCDQFSGNCRPLWHSDGHACVLTGSRCNIQGNMCDFDEDESSVASGVVTMTAHQKAVGRLAAHYARAAGLSEALVAAVEQAGLWHDLGKADPRFQAWLCGGDRALAIRLEQKHGDVLAKSDATPQTPAARSLARLKSGYPVGGRHELLSVRLAETSGLLDPLVRHLIASHHGYCRPFAPVVEDSQPVTVRYAGAACPSATGLERLDSGIAHDFWMLIRRYGWWGLAYVEAVLRLADHRVSERGQ
jgi:CRISPR-associated endonuclease/helicase Cas3